MAFYTGIDCPVCGKPLKEDEDIVTCPVCGTPSHRSCYEQLGHCVNADKHSEQFAFNLDAERKNVEAVQPPADAVAYPPAPQRAGGGEASLPQQPFGLPGMMGMPFMPGIDALQTSTEKILGERISDVASVVRTKINYYLHKFKRMEDRRYGLSWNWSAFIFGPYWFFFRRMSKFGALYLSIQLIVQLLLQGIFFTQINTFWDNMYGAFGEEALTNAALFTDPAKVQQMMEFAEKAGMLPYIIALFGVMLLVHLVFGLFANRAYRGHCVAVVRKVKERADDPNLLEQVAAAGYPVKTKAELLRFYLMQMGGTSVFSVMTGYVAYNLVTMLISYLL